MFPDHSYRKPGADFCEWVVELKVWSLNGANKLDTEARACVELVEDDAKKCRGWPEGAPYTLLFLAVNVPAKFYGRRQNKYSSEEFVDELVKKMKASPGLGRFARDALGDLCAAVKTIDTGANTAGLSRCLATQGFAESPHRPQGVDYSPFP